MSHSITTTASYDLNKYSRSYPSVGARAPVESEWQHFTNPIMRIALEAKKSPSGQLVSMRLKIIWSLHTELNDLHADQREVVFEDLELLSFSSLPTRLDQLESLPLKAVYRDAVVGIRYLHPRTVPPGSQPTYRRFQIVFKDAPDASRCIDAIKSVCPCKASPPPAHLNRHSTILSASLARAATTVPDPASVRPVRPTERQNTMSVLAPMDSRVNPSTMPSHPLDNQPFPRTALPAVATSLSSDDSAFVTCSETSYRTDTRMDRWKDDLPQDHGRDAAQSSLPNSSQPPSSEQSVIMPPPPVPRHLVREAVDAITPESSRTANTGDEGSQLLASLSRHPSLYELSRTDLETLVSQIIREEGFLHLLEALDSMWRIKGFLGR